MFFLIQLLPTVIVASVGYVSGFGLDQEYVFEVNLLIIPT